MKKWVLVTFVLSIAATVNVSFAASKDVTKTCVYRYLSCKDNCEYFQNFSQIKSCKSSCNKRYSCRPKKKN